MKCEDVFNKAKEIIGEENTDDYRPAIFSTEPQIFKDRLGRYVFEPVRIGLKDCCGFVYRIFGRSVK